MNRQIIRPNEKTILARLVDIMVALELRFLQDRNEDGQLVYRLDPCVHLWYGAGYPFAEACWQACRRIHNLRWQAGVGHRALEVRRQASSGDRGKFYLRSGSSWFLYFGGLID